MPDDKLAVVPSTVYLLGKIGFLRNFQYNPKLSLNTVSLDYFIGEWDFAPTEQNPIPLLSRFRDLGGSVGYVVDPFFLYRTGPYLLLVEFLLVTG